MDVGPSSCSVWPAEDSDAPGGKPALLQPWPSFFPSPATHPTWPCCSKLGFLNSLSKFIPLCVGENMKQDFGRGEQHGGNVVGTFHWRGLVSTTRVCSLRLFGSMAESQWRRPNNLLALGVLTMMLPECFGQDTGRILAKNILALREISLMTISGCVCLSVHPSTAETSALF